MVDVPRQIPHFAFTEMTIEASPRFEHLVLNSGPICHEYTDTFNAPSNDTHQSASKLMACNCFLFSLSSSLHSLHLNVAVRKASMMMAINTEAAIQMIYSAGLRRRVRR